VRTQNHNKKKSLQIVNIIQEIWRKFFTAHWQVPFRAISV